jgi:hypothetical protein
MLFINWKGEVIEITRMDYTTDKEYYIAIMKLKCH